MSLIGLAQSEGISDFKPGENILELTPSAYSVIMSAVAKLSHFESRDLKSVPTPTSTGKS